MLPYLTSETEFIRAFGNRSLLLVFLCVLTRSGSKPGSGSFMGVSLDVSQGHIVVFGPILALLILAFMKVEADGLLLARSAIATQEGSKATFRPSNNWILALFFVPSLAALFLVVQFITNMAPAERGCAAFDWMGQFADFRHQGWMPSIYCIRDIKEGMPWIFTPAQTYLYLACVGACFWLSSSIAKCWGNRR